MLTRGYPVGSTVRAELKGTGITAADFVDGVLVKTANLQALPNGDAFTWTIAKDFTTEGTEIVNAEVTVVGFWRLDYGQSFKHL